MVILLAVVGLAFGVSLARRRQAAIAEAELWVEASDEA